MTIAHARRACVVPLLLLAQGCGSVALSDTPTRQDAPSAPAAEPAAPPPSAAVAPPPIVPRAQVATLRIRFDAPGNYSVIAGGRDRLTVAMRPGGGEVLVPIRAPGSFRGLTTIEIRRSYQEDGPRTATARLTIPYLSFSPWPKQREIVLGAMLQGECKPPDTGLAAARERLQPNTEADARDLAIYWRGIAEACDGAGLGGTRRLLAFARALLAEKMLIQFAPEDNVISDELWQRARQAQDGDLCKGTRLSPVCGTLKMEIEQTRYLDYKLYDRLSYLAWHLAELSEPTRFLDALQALRVADRASQDCVAREAHGAVCDKDANFALLGEILCGEAQTRNLRGHAALCPLRSTATTPAATPAGTRIPPPDTE